MSLYVAVPYIVAHRVGQTVGVLWLNSAETWIDTSSAPTGLIRSALNKVLSLFLCIQCVRSSSCQLT